MLKVLIYQFVIILTIFACLIPTATFIKTKICKKTPPTKGRGKYVPLHTEYLHNVLTHFSPIPGLSYPLGK